MSDNRNRSIFWPLLLIAVGLIWLLGNLNVFPEFDFGLFLSLWPLLLIISGLNIIIGRRAPLLRNVISVLALAGAIAYVYFAPFLGIATGPEIKHEHFSEPVGEATSAIVRIESAIGRTTITALADSNDLIDADIAYIDEVSFEVEGTTEKSVVLESHAGGINTDIFDSINEDQLVWDIGLTPDLPITLDFTGGVGEMDLDLTGLDLTEVLVRGGVGDLTVLLPAQAGLYSVQIKGGVGRFTIEIADGAEVSLDVEAGVGEIVIKVPEDAGVELQASTGVGSINLPSNFVELSANNQPVGASGTWRTENYDTAAYQIFIEFQGGVGGLRVR